MRIHAEMRWSHKIKPYQAVVHLSGTELRETPTDLLTPDLFTPPIRATAVNTTQPSLWAANVKKAMAKLADNLMDPGKSSAKKSSHISWGGSTPSTFFGKRLTCTGCTGHSCCSNSPIPCLSTSRAHANKKPHDAYWVRRITLSSKMHHQKSKNILLYCLFWQKKYRILR